LWESELLTFQQSLHAREKHLSLVERNLSDYLSPFNDSTAGVDSTVVGSTPNKLHALSEEQRRMLRSIATPIIQRHAAQLQQQQQQLSVEFAELQKPLVPPPLQIASPISVAALLTPPPGAHSARTRSASSSASARDRDLSSSNSPVCLFDHKAPQLASPYSPSHAEISMLAEQQVAMLADTSLSLLDQQE